MIRPFRPTWALGLILAIYMALGALFAVQTPLWQTPDEPAHFNYARQLATTGQLPVLRPGDYDQAYLDVIKTRHFPPDMAVDGIRYEGHQPPLYYALAAVLHRLTSTLALNIQVWALRLLGVALGAGVVAFVWASSLRLFPGKVLRASLSAGFVAFLPMHIAMMAAVNNDPLSELLIAWGVFRLLGHLQQPAPSARGWLLTGIVVGLGLLAKFQAYILLPLAAAVWLWQVGRTGWGRSAWRGGVGLFALALTLPLPWWLRNISVYGPGDPVGLQMHNAIVTGQPRTTEWIAAFGWQGYLDRFAGFTFKSFWGVFGWLGVFMDERVYQLLGCISLLVLAGWAWQVWRRRQGRLRLQSCQRLGLALLALQVLAVVGTYGWYNLTFVQHQGRYLFPALLPIGIAFALGWEGLMSPGGSRWGAIVALAGAMALGALGAWRGNFSLWLMFMAVALGVGLAVRSRWPSGRPEIWAAASLLLFVAIDVYAVWGAIVPQLRP